jgi:hypothetical protein
MGLSAKEMCQLQILLTKLTMVSIPMRLWKTTKSISSKIKMILEHIYMDVYTVFMG